MPRQRAVSTANGIITTAMFIGGGISAAAHGQADILGGGDGARRATSCASSSCRRALLGVVLQLFCAVRPGRTTKNRAYSRCVDRQGECARYSSVSMSTTEIAHHRQEPHGSAAPRRPGIGGCSPPRTPRRSGRAAAEAADGKHRGVGSPAGWAALWRQRSRTAAAWSSTCPRWTASTDRRRDPDR